MRPEIKLKFQNILLIIGIGLFFGLLYNYLFYPHSLTEYLEAAVISIVLALIVGVLEEFVFNKVFQAIPFLFVLIIRSLLYSILTSTVLCLVLSIETAYVEKISYSEAVSKYLRSPLFKRDFFFSLFFVVLMLFIIEVIILIGKANFFRLVLGLYHKPRAVTRIFMFVDLKNSTSISEKLPNKLYSTFIKDYFYDISDAVLMFNGEVYQYVGDEMIVVWPVGRANIKCIRCFFKMREIIERKRQQYFEKFGMVPEFKAGMHAGEVIVTSVGKQKKEIVYHGVVLNTTSRIEGKCNELNQRLLVSEDLLDFIKPGKEYSVEEKGEIELRGRTTKLRLYGITPGIN